MTTSSSKGISEAIRFLKQERRFLQKELQERNFLVRLLAPTPTTDHELDLRLEKKQRGIINESGSKNELGLYRNASLTLACICVGRNDLRSALDFLLDVAFLDMNGATNSLPGYKSYDRQTADLVEFVSDIIRDAAMNVNCDIGALEEPFKARWSRFSGFGKPPYAPDPTWRKLKKALEG